MLWAYAVRDRTRSKLRTSRFDSNFGYSSHHFTRFLIIGQSCVREWVKWRDHPYLKFYRKQNKKSPTKMLSSGSRPHRRVRRSFLRKNHVQAFFPNSWPYQWVPHLALYYDCNIAWRSYTFTFHQYFQFIILTWNIEEQQSWYGCCSYHSQRDGIVSDEVAYASDWMILSI